MNEARSNWLVPLKRLATRPGGWLILVVLALITIPYYGEAIRHPTFITGITRSLGIERHAFERILYLAPIVWAGFLFGRKGALTTSLAALAIMLPRALFISAYTTDAIFESAAVFILGNVLALSFDALSKERKHRLELEATQEELRASEERYRQLFENAHDAIWLHDPEGNIITANQASALLTGYSLKEFPGIRTTSLLSPESLETVRAIEERLVRGEVAGSLNEVKLIRKDGSEAFVQLATNLVPQKDSPPAFQHIARDISEQKRMQENLQFYLQQATRAQEEERKRISRELHDDTIQALVVLFRQLDAIASGKRELAPETRLRLEELRRQTNTIMEGVRRLSQDLRPAALDRLGLVPTLQWLAADVARFSRINTRVNAVGTERPLPEEVKLVLFRITQEALRNIWRHSGATEAEITLDFEQGKTRISIADNGRGFSLPQSIGDLARDGKLGLAGMQERARLIGGSFSVKSEPGKGATVTVEIPA
ncbi:MAG: PAS domain S-box protein [Chloroflexota bacterium]